MTRIEIAVNNPKAAALSSCVALIPVGGLVLIALGASDLSGVRAFWPVILAIGVGCFGFLVAIAAGIWFLFRGKYVIEHDDLSLRIRRMGLRESASPAFAWNQVRNVGFFSQPGLGTSGFLGVESILGRYTFGGELIRGEQIKLAEELYRIWQEKRSQQGGGHVR